MKDAEKLIEKYRLGTCSQREKDLLEKWFHHLGETDSSNLSEQDLSNARESFRKKAEAFIIII